VQTAGIAKDKFLHCIILQVLRAVSDIREKPTMVILKVQNIDYYNSSVSHTWKFLAPPAKTATPITTSTISSTDYLDHICIIINYLDIDIKDNVY
jgi:hypothetical protein